METYYRPQDLLKFPEIGKEAPALAQKFFDYYQAVFAEGALTETGKGPDRPGRGPCGPVPLLHRRLYPGLPGKRVGPERDDRGRARGRGHSGRGFPGPRGPDAQRGRKNLHVNRFLDGTGRQFSGRKSFQRSRTGLEQALQDHLDRTGIVPGAGSDYHPADQCGAALQPDLPPLPPGCRTAPPGSHDGRDGRSGDRLCRAEAGLPWRTSPGAPRN